MRCGSVRRHVRARVRLESSVNAPLQRVVDALDAHGCNPRKTGTGWSAKCPAHDDNNPSLSVAEGDQHPVVLNCQAGCTPEAVLEALGLTWADVCEPTTNCAVSPIGDEPTTTTSTIVEAADRISLRASPEIPPAGGPFALSGLEYTAHWVYTDAGGADLFAVVRYNDEHGKKTYRQWRRNGTGWTPGLGDTERVIYNLPAVLEAVKQGWTIYVVEGEKCADALNALNPDVTATTNPMGAGKWRPNHTATLERAAKVIVWADDNEPGKDHAHAVAESLRGAVDDVSVVVSPHAHDAADHLAAGHGLDDVVRLEDESTVEVVGEAVEHDQAAEYPLPPICYRGAVKDYCESLAKTTEAGPALHFLSFMTVVGHIIGRRAYLPDAGWVFCNLFAALVGETGTDRKSTSIALGRRILTDYGIDPIMMASFEGLLEDMAEAGETVSRNMGARGFLMPGEFRSFAAKAMQKGTSGLIPGLTELYDCNPTFVHRLKGKGKKLRVERPYLTILTSTTDAWLKESMDESQIAGGFLNRWVFVDAAPKAANPFPDQPDEELWNSATEAIRKMHKALRHEGGLAMRWTPEAREVYKPFYIAHRNEKRADEVLKQLAPRLPTVAIKLAMIYSLLDGSDGEIGAEPMQAGVAFAKWQSQAHRRLFQGFSDDPRKRLEDRMMRKLEAFHAQGKKPKRWELQQAIGGKTSAAEFDYALQALNRNDQLTIDPETKCIKLNRP